MIFEESKTKTKPQTIYLFRRPPRGANLKSENHPT